jgi:hypothetical protein
MRQTVVIHEPTATTLRQSSFEAASVHTRSTRTAVEVHWRAGVELLDVTGNELQPEALIRFNSFRCSQLHGETPGNVEGPGCRRAVLKDAVDLMRRSVAMMSPRTWSARDNTAVGSRSIRRKFTDGEDDPLAAEYDPLTTDLDMDDATPW